MTMNEDQLSISTRIEIDKRSSMNDIDSFLESVEKNSIVGIKLDVQSLAKQFKEATNTSMTFNDDGSLKALTSQIVDENGRILEIKKRVNEANELEVVSARIVNNEVKKQTELEKVKLKHQQAQRDLALQISKLKNGKNGEYLTAKDIATIEKAQREFEELDATSMDQLNNSLKDTKLNLREIDNNANNTRLRTTVDHVNSLSQSFKNLGLTISGAMIIRELWRSLREGTQYIKELDEAFTDIAISMDITRKEFNNWTQDARKIAQANGVLTTSIMDMVKIYATAGEDISEVQDKLAGTAMIQNITQWDADETTSVVNSIVNQYKLLEKEINGTTGNVANAIEYMGDALIGISNELTVDNVQGIREMASAIDTAGSIMEQSGASMEWYMATAGVMNEKMNATGDEWGNASKMFVARTFAQAQAMEDLGESTENIEIESRKAEKALNSVGISVRDASNPSSLRDFEDIMDELATKWDTLSDATKNYVGEGVAGTNRRNYFTTMLENYDRVTELTNAGLEAQGELTKANEVRVNSLAGQINILTDKMLSFMDGLQPIVHGSVQLGNSILDIVNKIGSVPVALGLVTSAFIGFTKEGRMVRDGVIDITKNLISMAMRTKLTATETKVATVATKGFKLEIGLLQSAMTFGLSLAIGAVVSGLSYLIDRMKNSSKYAKEMADDVSSALGDINDKIENTSTADKMITQYKKLGDEISLLSVDTEEYREKVEELKTIKGQLLDLFPTAIAGYDSEGNAILTTKDNLEKLNEAEKENLRIQQEALKIKAEANYNDITKKLAEAEKDKKDIQNQIKIAREQSQSDDSIARDAGLLALNELAVQLETIQSEVLSYTTTLNTYKNVLGITTDETDNLSNSTNEAKDSLDELSESSGNLGFDDFIISDDKIRQASENFVELSKNISEAKELLSDINENGLNFNNAQQVLDMFEDFKGNINDTSVVQDFLNQKITEMGDLANESYLTMSKSSESFWNSSNANSQEYFSSVIKNTSEWERFTKRVNENLDSIHAQMINSMGENYEKYFKDVANAYNIDLSNCKTAGEARIKIEAEVAEKIAQMRKAIAEASYNHGTVTMADGTEVNYGEYHETADTEAFNTAISQIQSWKNQAINALGQIGSMQQSTFGGTTPMNGSSSSSSSSSKKEIEDLDLKIDRYYDLTDAINDLDKALERNETAQENASPKERLRLMEEEISLYKKKQRAIQNLINEQQNQLVEFKNQISKYGGTFDGNGDIIGRTDLLKKLQNQANSLSGDAKEAKKEEIESLMDIIEAYEKLNNETLPDTRNEYEEMTNTIKQAERENLEFIEDVQEQISESYQKHLDERYSALKKSLEKEKNAYLDTYDEEDFDRDLSDENRKLNEIAQQIAIYSRDASLSGRQRLEQLKQDYEDQQQAISDLIRDREKDLGSDRFDEEMDKLDEELESLLSAENIAKVVNKALQSGVIDLGDTMMNLNDFMLQSIKDQEDAYFALGSTIQTELIDKLEIAKGLWGSVGNSSITGRTIDTSNSRSALSNLSDLTSRISGSEIQSMGTQMLYGTQMQLATDNLRQMISNIDMSKLSSLRGILENNNSPLVSVVVEGNMDNVTQNELLKAMESTVQKTITKISKAIK